VWYYTRVSSPNSLCIVHFVIPHVHARLPSSHCLYFNDEIHNMDGRLFGSNSFRTSVRLNAFLSWDCGCPQALQTYISMIIRDNHGCLLPVTFLPTRHVRLTLCCLRSWDSGPLGEALLCRLSGSDCLAFLEACVATVLRTNPRQLPNKSLSIHCTHLLTSNLTLQHNLTSY